MSQEILGCSITSIGEQFEAAGFERRDDRYQRNGHVVSLAGGWMSVRTSHASELAKRNGEGERVGNNVMLGRPGLWRLAGEREVFELPADVVRAAGHGDDDDFESEAMTFEACLNWAVATADGNRNGWTPPPRQDIDNHVKDSALTVQIAGIVRETLIDHREDRLAFRCPIIPALPDDLPAERRAWLDEIVADAEAHWRLARVGIDPKQRALVAEIDLTGAPANLIAALAPVAVDALRWVVEWAAVPAAVIADTSVSCGILASAPTRV